MRKLSKSLTFYQKIRMVLTSPRELFREIKKEELRKSIEYDLVISSILVAISIIAFLSYSSMFGSTAFLLNIFVNPKAFLSMILIYFLFLLLQLGFSIGFSIIQSLYLHLCTKLIGIRGNTWDYTLKAIIYSHTTYIYSIPVIFLIALLTSFNLQSMLILLILILLFIWNAAIVCIGISELHDTTLVRSILSVIVSLAIVGTIIFMLFLVTQKI